MKTKTISTAIFFSLFLKLSFAQLNVQWNNTFTGANTSDAVPAAMTTDQFKNVYVTTETNDSGTVVTYIATIKYSSSGVQQWIAYYYGPSGSTTGFDSPRDIAVDINGNVYVSGVSATPATNGDYVTIKYDSTGNERWAVRYTSAGFFQDIPAELVVDDTGNVYVTGWSGQQGLHLGDYATVKYDSAGNLKWSVVYDRGSVYDDRATNIALDDSGNVIVSGWEYNPPTNTDWRLTTVKYNNAGVQQWVTSDTSAFEVRSTDMTVDHFGNIIVSGYTSHGINNDDQDWIVSKYSPAGLHDWSHLYNGTSNGADCANKLILDVNGNIYATGFAFDSLLYENVLTIKYDSAGNVVWQRTYNGPGGDTDLGYQVFLSTLGQVYVTGLSSNVNNNFDYLILKYDTSGTFAWGYLQDGGLNDDDDPVDAVLDINDEISVTGRLYNGNDNDVSTIKFIEITGIAEKNLANAILIYPNPAENSFRISSSF